MVRFASVATFLTIAASVAPTVVADVYEIVKTYQGPSFFDEWDFYGQRDNATNGAVNYLDRKKAFKKRLAYVNDAGHAIMRVDNSTTGLKFGDKRDSIRIQTRDRFAVGSVWVADMLHTPYGCSVWPAWWSSTNSWPNGGEVDTFEGVNGVTMSQMGLHTNPGCIQKDPIQSSTLINSTDCSHYANNNQGCIVTNPTNKSYGLPFAQAGGGVWVTEYGRQGVSIWFFTRNNVPDSIKNGDNSLNTTALGKPVANWPTSGCDMNTFFTPHHLIFNIALCGDYAGNDGIFAQTCPGVCYQDYILGDGSAYNNAYFEVASVRIFGPPGEDIKLEGSGIRIGGTSTWLAMGVATAMTVLSSALW